MDSPHENYFIKEDRQPYLSGLLPFELFLISNRRFEVFID